MFFNHYIVIYTDCKKWCFRSDHIVGQSDWLCSIRTHMEHCQSSALNRPPLLPAADLPISAPVFLNVSTLPFSKEWKKIKGDGYERARRNQEVREKGLNLKELFKSTYLFHTCCTYSSMQNLHFHSWKRTDIYTHYKRAQSWTELINPTCFPLVQTSFQHRSSLPRSPLAFSPSFTARATDTPTRAHSTTRRGGYHELAAILSFSGTVNFRSAPPPQI